MARLVLHRLLDVHRCRHQPELDLYSPPPPEARPPQPVHLLSPAKDPFDSGLPFPASPLPSGVAQRACAASTASAAHDRWTVRSMPDGAQRAR
jgi:hypothetical protein